MTHRATIKRGECVKESKDMMPIRLIARDLYRLQKKVEELEERLHRTPFEWREPIEEELRISRAERNRIRRMLEGSKQEPIAKTPR
jgi:hypothetical protein